MKTASQSLIDLLSTDHFRMADLYVFRLVSGTVLRLTTWDDDLVVSGLTYLSRGPLIERSQVSWKTGISVDELQITVYPDSNDLVDGVSFLAAIKQGALDGAEVELSRVFMPAAGDTSTGAILLFAGRVSAIDAIRVKAEITVASFTELLNVKMPRSLYSPSCTLTLFEPACGKVKSSFDFVGTVAGGATLHSITVPDVTKEDGYFDQGYLTLDGGAIRRTVKSWRDNKARVIVPLLEAPEEGAAIRLYAGCDKTRTTCDNKFNNLIHFRGCPFIPQPETAL